MSDARTRIVEAGYDALGERFGRWAAQVEDPDRDRFLEAFASRLPDGAPVLELGCGPARGATQLLARRFALTAVDISAAQLDLARTNAPGARLVHADILEASFEPASFDGVAAFYVLNHVPRDRLGDLLGRVAAWLRPGGLFVASFGAGGGADWVGDWIGATMYFSSWDERTNRRLLADAGFTLLLDERVTAHEPEGEATFQWVLARR